MEKFKWFIARRLEMSPSHCNHFKQTMPSGIVHPTVWGPSANSLALILFVPALQANFLEQLPKLVAFQIFWSPYLSCGESLKRNTLSHYHYTHIERISESITYITKKTPKLVAKFWLPNLILYQTDKCVWGLPQLTKRNWTSYGNVTIDQSNLSQ